MAGVGDILNLQGLKVDEISVEILDFVYGRNAILLQNVGEILNLGSTGIPIPIVGFEYKIPDEVEILKFSYSKYPFMNRTTIVNAYIKEATTLTLEADKPITQLNPFIANYPLNELIVSTLDKYISNGGLFTILTPWAVIKDCLCTKFVGFKIGERDIGGQGFRFSFEKANIPSEVMQKKQNAYLSAITGGSAL